MFDGLVGGPGVSQDTGLSDLSPDWRELRGWLPGDDRALTSSWQEASLQGADVSQSRITGSCCHQTLSQCKGIFKLPRRMFEQRGLHTVPPKPWLSFSRMRGAVSLMFPQNIKGSYFMLSIQYRPLYWPTAETGIELTFLGEN